MTTMTTNANAIRFNLEDSKIPFELKNIIYAYLGKSKSAQIMKDMLDMFKKDSANFNEFCFNEFADKFHDDFGNGLRQKYIADFKAYHEAHYNTPFDAHQNAELDSYYDSRYEADFDDYYDQNYKEYMEPKNNFCSWYSFAKWKYCGINLVETKLNVFDPKKYTDF
jgi:hypothetical protein